MTTTPETTGAAPTLAEFHGTTISIVTRDGQKWLTADQAGRALGYSVDLARISTIKLFNRHVDEFTEAETCVVKLTTQGQGRDTRIFSATGCIKLGFFANTRQSKKFRHWASEVLTNSQPTPDQRPTSVELSHLRAQVAQLQATALAANPRWAAVARYRAMGLTRNEIARLLGSSLKAVEKLITTIKAAGLPLAAPTMPAPGTPRSPAPAVASAQTAQANLFAEAA